jgi:hypothetical protein
MPQPASPRSRRLDLAIGIVLGIALGLLVAYVLVIAIGGGKDASEISTPQTAPPPKGATTAPGPSGI